MEDDAAMLLAADARTAVINRRWPGAGRDGDARTRTAPRLAPEQFCGWLAMAMPGDSTVYYQGHLGRDRCRSTSVLSEPDRLRLIALARQALLAAEDGRVHLIQRRHGEGEYSYIAVKASLRFGVTKRVRSARQVRQASDGNFQRSRCERGE
jgi:hypothetical protein